MAGGVAAPRIFGALIGTGQDRLPLTYGYEFWEGVLIVGGIIALVFGVNAERKPLEEIAAPLSLVGREDTSKRSRPSLA